MVSALTYSATALPSRGPLPIMPRFSPPNAFLSPLYCPVPIKAENAQKHNFEEKKKVLFTFFVHKNGTH